MIVNAEFLDHWKTRLLAKKLEDPAAPLAVIRLWAHCQTSRRDLFTPLKPEVLAAIYHWPGDPKKLLDAMLESGFLDQEGESIRVHGWRDANRQLVAAWENGRFGALGGRPKNDPPGSQKKPVGYPSATRTKPEKSREEKSGVDKGDVGSGAAAPPASRNPLDDEAWLKQLEADSAYEGIPVRREHAKMTTWCREHQKQPTRRRFVNWLNRVDRPMTSEAGQPNHGKGFFQ